MSNTIVGQIFIDTRRESYSGLIEDSWADGVHDSATPAPLLQEYVSNLLLAWRAADYTARLPVILLEILQGVQRDYTSQAYSNTNVLAMTEAIRDKLIHEVEDL